MLLAVVYLVGCMSPQVAPADAIAQIRGIAVVPIQMPPTTITPALMQTFEAHGGGTGGGPGVGLLLAIVILYSLVAEWPERDARRNRAVELLAKWAATKDPWNPAQLLAADAAALLHRSTIYRDITVNEVVVLPGVTVSEPTWHMENWMRPRRAWYRQADSLVNVSEAKAFGADAILEISAGPIEVGRDHLFLQVAVKVISTSTNEMLGRSNCGAFSSRSAPLEDIFKNEGELFKSIYGELSRKILDQCLREAGLVR